MDKFILRAQLRAVLPNGASLHASTVAQNGSALVFLAPSGGGKTTIMKKMCGDGWGLIADDSVVISKGTDGCIRALPCGSLKQSIGTDRICGATLKALYFVEKGSPPAVLKISSQYACYRILNSNSLMAYGHINEREQKQVRSFIRYLFGTLPSYIIRYSLKDSCNDMLVSLSHV